MMGYILVVNTWANSWRKDATEKDVQLYYVIRTYFVSLLAVLVLRLALEPVCPVHILCFVISAIDEHVLGVQPYNQSIAISTNRTSVDQVY